MRPLVGAGLGIANATCSLPSGPSCLRTTGHGSPWRSHNLFNARFNNFVVSRSSRRASCRNPPQRVTIENDMQKGSCENMER